MYEPMLMGNTSWVSACNKYRGMREGENEEEYVERLAKELDEEFQRVGPETVCAFVAEPVVGAVSISMDHGVEETKWSETDFCRLLAAFLRCLDTSKR